MGNLAGVCMCVCVCTYVRRTDTIGELTLADELLLSEGASGVERCTQYY